MPVYITRLLTWQTEAAMPVYMEIKLMVTSINHHHHHHQVNIVQSASGRWTLDRQILAMCCLDLVWNSEQDCVRKYFPNWIQFGKSGYFSGSAGSNQDTFQSLSVLNGSHRSSSVTSWQC